MGPKEKTENRLREAPLARNLVSALQESFKDNLWGVVLFGSRAKGEGRRESDWDVLIFADGISQNPVDRTIFLRDLFFQKGIRGISPIFRTREEFEKRLRPPYLDITWDGILLSDHKGYVGYVCSKKKEIKEIVKKSGLKRVKKRGGWFWEWKIPPKAGEWEIEWKR